MPICCISDTIHCSYIHREYILEQEATIQEHYRQIQEMQAVHLENANNEQAKVTVYSDLWSGQRK